MGGLKDFLNRSGKTMPHDLVDAVRLFRRWERRYDSCLSAFSSVFSLLQQRDAIANAEARRVHTPFSTVLTPSLDGGAVDSAHCLEDDDLALLPMFPHAEEGIGVLSLARRRGSTKKNPNGGPTCPLVPNELLAMLLFRYDEDLTSLVGAAAAAVEKATPSSAEWGQWDALTALDPALSDFVRVIFAQLTLLRLLNTAVREDVTVFLQGGSPKSRGIGLSCDDVANDIGVFPRTIAATPTAIDQAIQRVQLERQRIIEEHLSPHYRSLLNQPKQTLT